MKFLIIFMGLTFSHLSNSATLTLDFSGNLLGATDIDISGSLYDVSFLDGSCAQVYNGCNSNNDFIFNSNQAELASQALLSQVFIDSTSGTFDTSVSLINGCESFDECKVYTAFGTNWEWGNVQIADNNSIESGDSVYYGGVHPTIVEFSNIENSTWATWSPVTPVPLPASIWIFISGLLGIISLGVKRVKA